MAITGKFLADFAAFHTAVTESEVRLRGMETGAGKVEGSLNKMVDSFSGRTIVTQATLATEAVDRIGGASKLTEAEQRKVNATVTEAIAKYAALGQQAPANMLALAEATKKVEAPTEGLSGKMVAFGTAVGTMAANALAALGRLALDGLKMIGTAIGELIADGARLSGVENSFQTLARSMNQTGEAMLGAMRTGTRGLVTDMDLMGRANQAVLLGLPVTADEMGDLAETASTLGRAMGITANQAFGDLITALGRSSPMILDNLGLSVKVGEANEKYAAALGKTAEQLTDAEKKTAFYNAAMEAARAKVETLGEAHLTLGEQITTAGVAWENFKNDLAIAIARSPVLGAGLDALGDSLAAAFGGSQEELIKKIIAVVNRLAIGVVDAGLVLIEWGRTGAQVFGAMQVPIKAVSLVMTFLIERFAAGLATMASLAQQLPGVGGAFDDVSAATHNAALIWGEARAEASRSLQSSLDLATGQGVVHQTLDKVSNALVNMKAAMVAATVSTKAEREEAEKQGVIHGNAIAMWAGEEDAIKKASAAQTKFTADLKKFDEEAEQASRKLPVFAGLFGELETKITSLTTSTRGLTTGLEDFAATVADNATPKLDEFKKKTEEVIAVSAAWKALLEEAARAGSLLRLDEQGRIHHNTPGPGAGGVPAGNLPMVNPFTGEGMAGTDPRVRLYLQQGYTLNEAIALANGTGFSIGQPHGYWDATGWHQGSRPVGMAAGGPVSAGAPYIVGERGPELFVPKQSGQIVPNGAGATFNLTVQVTQPLGTPTAIARAVREALVDFARSSGQRLTVGA